MKRSRWFRFITIVLLSLFVSFFLRSCLPSAAFGQDSRENTTAPNEIKFKKMAEFLIKNADQRDFSVPLEKNTFKSEEFKRSLLSWKQVTGRNGGIFLHAQGSLEFPKSFSLGDNEAKARANLSIVHEGIESIEKLPPHFQVEFVGSASDRDLFSGLSRKIGYAELTFRGLMLKGIPKYLEQTAAVKKLEENGLDFDSNSDRDDEAKLSKTIEASKLNQLVVVANSLGLKASQIKLNADKRDALRYRGEISELENSLEQARKEGDADLIKLREERLQVVKSKLQGVQDSIQRNLADKNRVLANSSPTASFICAPEFMREFKFPIFERKVSTSGQGSSASVGVGVTGDVVIDIRAPTCTVTFNPPFPFEVNSSVYSDVSLTSNGYFGGRADASGEQGLGVNFSGNYGNYTLTNVTLNEDEKKAIAELVLKSVDDAKNDEQLLNKLANEIKDAFTTPVINAIESALIGTDSAPFDSSTLCSLFKKIGGIVPNSEEDSLCWASSLSTQPGQPIKPTLPPLILPPQPPKPPNPAPGRVCRAATSLPCKYIPASTITVPPYPCGTWKNPKLCHSVDVPESEFPLGCRVAKQANDNICSQLQAFNKKVNEINNKWEQAKKKARDDYNVKKNRIETAYNTDFAKWQTDLSRWQSYRTSSFVRNVAKKFIHNRVLLGTDVIDSKAIAQKLLNLVWKIQEGSGKVNELVDLTNNYLQRFTPERLSINVAASGRLAFSSTASLLKTRPQITTDSKLDFDKEKPSFKTTFFGYVNGPEAEEGRVGGLDALGIKLIAEQAACLGGKIQTNSSGELSCPSGKKIHQSRKGRQKPWNLLPTIGGETLPAGKKMS